MFIIAVCVYLTSVGLLSTIYTVHKFSLLSQLVYFLFFLIDYLFCGIFFFNFIRFGVNFISCNVEEYV